MQSRSSIRQIISTLQPARCSILLRLSKESEQDHKPNTPLSACPNSFSLVHSHLLSLVHHHRHHFLLKHVSFSLE
ncbi:hypothetical protein PGTUg99_015996 [Puccinia graminis f. sp. tritici]|uniref:Uncharacterized protein n=1 Tax=Puccinia graminis f. sp. tritici TaxID=56615 RepID=A0A5B0M4P2_PUCGR|nr:hypothetical protein PGTUg99_015996 [Puccinia graminis f. sp. tritici]